MAAESSSVSAIHPRLVEPASPRVPAVDAAFEERWAAWQDRGHRHDVAIHRRIRSIAVITAIAAGLVILGLFNAGGPR